MAFDRTNPTHLTQLKDEVQNDSGQGTPMGYDPDGWVDIIDKINDPVQNVGGESNTDNEFTGDDLLASIATNPAEYGVVVSSHAQSAVRTTFIEALVGRQQEVIPKRFHVTILAIFTVADAGTIRTEMVALATSALTRAEVLWGADSVINRADWFAARAS